MAGSSGRDESRAVQKPRLPKTSRILRHADFERVYKQGKRHFAANMTVFYLERSKDLSARIGFTVGRALGGAVQRNRMRRRLREAVRIHGLPEAPVDIVVNPKKSLLTADFTAVQEQVARAMEVIAKVGDKIVKGKA